MYVKNKKDNRVISSIVEGLQESKALNITLIDLSKIKEAVCEYFVICHANSSTHVQSIAENFSVFVKKDIDFHPIAKEGVKNSEWILVDYGHLVVHVFLHEKRQFYDIEGLWGDGKITEIDHQINALLDYDNTSL